MICCVLQLNVVLFNPTLRRLFLTLRRRHPSPICCLVFLKVFTSSTHRGPSHCDSNFLFDRTILGWGWLDEADWMRLTIYSPYIYWRARFSTPSPGHTKFSSSDVVQPQPNFTMQSSAQDATTQLSAQNVRQIYCPEHHCAIAYHFFWQPTQSAIVTQPRALVKLGLETRM